MSYIVCSAMIMCERNLLNVVWWSLIGIFLSGPVRAGPDEEGCLDGLFGVCEKLGLAEYRTKNYTEAIRWFKLACKGGFHERSCALIGDSLQHLGKPEGARQAFEYACSQGTHYACFNLGMMAKNAGKLSLAKEYFERACEDGKRGEGCYQMGLIEKEQGNDKAARNIWKRYCKHGGDYVTCAEICDVWCQTEDETECRTENPPELASGDQRPEIITENGAKRLVFPEGFIKATKRDYPSLRIPDERDMTGTWKGMRSHFPFVTWGDFNVDGLTDIAIILVSDTHWNWALYHQKPDGEYVYGYPDNSTRLISIKEVGEPQNFIASGASRWGHDAVEFIEIETGGDVTYWCDGEYRVITYGE